MKGFITNDILVVTKMSVVVTKMAALNHLKMLGGACIQLLKQTRPNHLVGFQLKLDIDEVRSNVV